MNDSGQAVVVDRNAQANQVEETIKKEAQEIAALIAGLTNKEKQQQGENARRNDEKYKIAFSEYIFSAHYASSVMEHENTTLPSLFEVSLALAANKKEISQKFNNRALDVVEMKKSANEVIVITIKDKKTLISTGETTAVVGSGNSYNISIPLSLTISLDRKKTQSVSQQTNLFEFKKPLVDEQKKQNYFAIPFGDNFLDALENGVKEYKESISFFSNPFRWLYVGWYKGRDKQVTEMEQTIADYKSGAITELAMNSKLREVSEDIFKSATVVKEENGKETSTSTLWVPCNNYFGNAQKQKLDALIEALNGNNSQVIIINQLLESFVDKKISADDFVLLFGADRRPELKEAIIQYLTKLDVDQLSHAFYKNVKKICEGLLEEENKKKLLLQKGQEHRVIPRDTELKTVEELIKRKEEFVRPLHEKQWQTVAGTFNKLVNRGNYPSNIENIVSAVNEIQNRIYAQKDKIAAIAEMKELSAFAMVIQKILNQTSTNQEIKNHTRTIDVAINVVSKAYLEKLEKLPSKEIKETFLEILNGTSWLGNRLNNRGFVVNAINVFLKKPEFQSFAFFSNDIENNEFLEDLLLVHHCNLRDALKEAAEAELKKMIDEESKKTITKKSIEALVNVLNGTPLIAFGDKNWGNGQELLDILCEQLKGLKLDYKDDQDKQVFIVSLLYRTVSTDLKVSDEQNLIISKAVNIELEKLISPDNTEDTTNRLIAVFNVQPLVAFGGKNWGNSKDLLDILCKQLKGLDPKKSSDLAKNRYIISLLGQIEKSVSAADLKINEQQSLDISRAVEIELERLFQNKDHAKIAEILQKTYMFKIGFTIGEYIYGTHDDIQNVMLEYIAKIGKSQSDEEYRNIFSTPWRTEYFGGLEFEQELVRAYNSPRHHIQYQELLAAIDSIELGKMPERFIQDDFNLEQIALDFGSGLFIPAEMLELLEKRINNLKITGKTSPYIVALLKAFVARMNKSETEEAKLAHNKLFAGYKEYLETSRSVLGFIESKITQENLTAPVRQIDYSEVRERKAAASRTFPSVKEITAEFSKMTEGLTKRITGMFDEEEASVDEKQLKAPVSEPVESSYNRHFESFLSDLKNKMEVFLKFEPNDHVLRDFDTFVNEIIEKIKNYSPQNLILFAQKFIEFFDDIIPSNASIRAINKLHVICALGVSECRDTEVDFMTALLKNDQNKIKETYKKIEEEYNTEFRKSAKKSIIERTSKILDRARIFNKELDLANVFPDRENAGIEDTEEDVSFSECVAVKLFAQEIITSYLSGKKSGDPLIDKFDEKTILRVVNEFPDMLSFENDGNRKLYSIFKDHLVGILDKYPEIRAEQNQQAQNMNELKEVRISPDKINFLCAIYNSLNNTEQKLALQKIIEEYNFRAMNHIRKLSTFENMDKKADGLDYMRNQNLFAVSILLVRLKGDPQQINEISSRDAALFCNCLKTESQERDANTTKILWYSQSNSAKTTSQIQIKTQIAEKRKNNDINPNMEFKYAAVSLTENFRDFILKQELSLNSVIDGYNSQIRIGNGAVMGDTSEDGEEIFKKYKLDKCINVLADYMLKNKISQFEDINETKINGEVKSAWNFVSSLPKLNELRNGDWFNFVKVGLEIRVQFLKILVLLSDPKATHKDLSDLLSSLEQKILLMVDEYKNKKEFQTMSLIYLEFIAFRCKIVEALSVIKQKESQRSSANRKQFVQRSLADVQKDTNTTQNNPDNRVINWDMLSGNAEEQNKKGLDKNYAESLKEFFVNMSVDDLLGLLTSACKNKNGKEMKFLMALTNSSDTCKAFSDYLVAKEDNILAKLFMGNDNNEELLKISHNLGVIRDSRLFLVERAVNANVLNKEDLSTLHNEYVLKFNLRLKALSTILHEMNIDENNQEIKTHIEKTIKMSLAFLMSGGSYFQIKTLELLLEKFGFLQDSNTMFNKFIEFIMLDNTAEKVKEIVGNKDELKALYLKTVLKDSRRERLLNDPMINLSDTQECRNHFSSIQKTILQMIKDGQLSDEIKILIAGLRDQQSSLRNDTYGKVLWNQCLSKIEGLKEILPISKQEVKVQVTAPVLPPRSSQQQSATKTMSGLNSSPPVSVPKFDLNKQIFGELEKVNNDSSTTTFERISKHIDQLKLVSYDWQLKFGQLLLTYHEAHISSYAVREFIQGNVNKFIDDQNKEDKSGDGLRRFCLKAVIIGVVNGDIKEECLKENSRFIENVYVDLKRRNQLPKLFSSSVDKLKTSTSGAAAMLLEQLNQLDKPIPTINSCSQEALQAEVKSRGPKVMQHYQKSF